MSLSNRSEEAMDWIVRLADPFPAPEVWIEFTAWLESDAANAAAYQSLSMANDDLSTARLISPEAVSKLIIAGDSIAENDNEASPWMLGWGRGMMAVAACGALLFGVNMFTNRGGIETFTTRPGEMREIALNDGSTIMLNGGTKLLLDRSHDRAATLVSGEAIFTITHDEDRPFLLKTDAGPITDVGTVFNVRLDKESVEVAVREGAVRYGDNPATATTVAGQKLRVTIADHTLSTSRFDVEAVGSWKSGVLDYKHAKMSEVALDLSRSLGTKVDVSANLADHRFTGVIQVSKDQKAMFQVLEPLLGVRATSTETGWSLKR